MNLPSRTSGSCCVVGKWLATYPCSCSVERECGSVTSLWHSVSGGPSGPCLYSPVLFIPVVGLEVCSFGSSEVGSDSCSDGYGMLIVTCA